MINRILIIAVLLFVSCDEEIVSAENVYGCTDEMACNFNPSATIYVPNSCDYELDGCGVCGGNNSSCDDFFSILLTNELGNSLGFEGVEGNHTDCTSTRLDNAQSFPFNFSVMSFPNPFNPSTTFDFSVTEPIGIGVKVIDVNYNDVDVLRELDTIGPGLYSLSWNGSDFPDGYYRVIFMFENVGETDTEISVPLECYYNIKKGSF